MLSQCSNSLCSAVFRYLHDGKVFVLQNDPAARVHQSKREYFWLCRDCSSKMTLRLGDDRRVLPVLLPHAVQHKPDSVASFSRDRKAGLILHSLSFPLLRKGASRKHVKRAHRAA